MQLMIWGKDPKHQTCLHQQQFQLFVSVYSYLFCLQVDQKKTHSDVFKCLTWAVVYLKFTAVRAKISEEEMFLLKTTERVHVHE